MTRREVFALLSAAAVTGLVGDTQAQTKGQPKDMHAAKYKALEETTGKCVSTGDDCLRHCLGMYHMKDTSMSGCADAVVQLIAACRALQTLAAVNSPHTPAFAKATAAVCASCEKECRKFDTVAVCHACAEACKACEDECRKVAA
jgi:Cys-rich four helix bundle protein (predicted Tat secretion target)